jgi:N-acyl homoserine lactone hydrolase
MHTSPQNAAHPGPRRLYLLQLSTTSLPLPTGQTLELSSGCYLIQTAQGQNILIDSGLPPDYTRPPGIPEAEHEKNVLEHLADLGLSPLDVSVVVSSHFDVDHSGYHDSFPQAEFVVQSRHYTSARSGDQRFAAARAHWDHPTLHYRLVEGDTELLPGLMLIDTSGHAPGHQSVLVQLPQTGKVLLAIDAVPIERLFTPDRSAWPDDDNEPELRASTRKLLDLVAREGVGLVIFGHDGKQWRTLKRAPDYYD